MVQSMLGPDHDLAKRLTNMEQAIQKLNTRDVLQNATFGKDGTTVEQAFTQLQDAINSAVAVQNAGGDAQNFAVTTTATEVASCILTVPTGFTRAVVNVVAFAEAFNPTAGGQYVYVQSTNSITGGSGEVYSLAAASTAVAVTTFQQVTLTGLSGGQQIVCGVLVRAGAAFSASTANLAEVSAQAIYLK